MQLNHEIESETFGSSWWLVRKSSNDFYIFVVRENFRFLKKKKLSGYKNYFPYTIPLSEKKLQNKEEISTDDKMPWKITFPF